MPIYEYVCARCGAFDQMQKMGAPPLSACPSCGGPVRRRISAVSAQFKGGGFYATDAGGVKKRLRKINRERQKDNEALLDGDVKGYNRQAQATDKKLLDVKPS